MAQEYGVFERARGGIASVRLMYEVKIALWLFLRGLSKRINFKLACNVANLGNFDDIFFQYEADGKSNAIILQLKYKERKTLNENFFFDKFLYQYCESYHQINKNFKKIKEKDLFKQLNKFDDLNFVIFTNGKLPENHCQLRSDNNHLLNEFLNINLYSNEKDGNKATYFHNDYYERCICESFKASASHILRIKSELKSSFEKKFGTDDHKEIVTAIKQLTNNEVIAKLDKNSGFYKEYENFLSEVVIFHNQPNIEELEDFILDEIRDLSDFDPSEVYCGLLDSFTAWHDKSNIVLTNNNFYEVLGEYSKPRTLIKKYFDNETYISRKIYKKGEKYNAFVVKSVEDIIDKTPLIISGAAGMGKTCYINYLFNLNPMHLWMHKIKLRISHNNLKDHVENNEQLLKKIIPYRNERKTKYMIRLLRENNYKLLIMVDGFDQSSNKKITDFLQYLSTKCTLIVTTRLNYAQKLTNDLNGNLYYLKEFCEDDRKLFIKNHCHLENKNKLLEEIGSTFKNRECFSHKNILENPFHLKMYLEYMDKQFKEDETQINPDSLYNFYKSLIDEKIKIYLIRTNSNNEHLYNDIKMSHIYYAIKYLDYDEDKEIKPATNLSTQDLIKVGFIDHFNSSEHPNFVHHIFAEYFLAVYLSEHLENEKNCKFISKHVIKNEFLGNILSTIIIKHSAISFNIIEDDVQLFMQNEDLNRKDAFGRTSLHLAFAVGACKISKYIINKDSYQLAEDIKGDTPLHYLISNMINLHVEIIKKVINKCGVNCVNLKKNTPLHVAAKYDFCENIQLLINDCNMNMKNINGDTPLLIATKYNHIQIAKKLLTNDNCDTNEYNENMESALLIAAKNGQTQLIKLLINSKKLDTSCKDPYENTALHLAASNNYPEIVDLLLKKMVSQINSLNAYYRRPLYCAADRGNTEVVKILLNYDECNVHLMNEDNYTALRIAAYLGHLAIVKLLINHKDCNINELNIYKDSPFHIALENNYINMVNLLIQNERFDINLQNDEKNAPLHLAAIRNRHEIVKLLISNKKCRINLFNHEKKTALHIAVFNTNEEMVKVLIDHGECIINCVTHNKETPLHFAVESDNVVIVKLLINKKGCDLNCQNNNGDTPLHIAVRKGNFDIVQLLINKSGCELNSKNNNGETPIMIATTKGFSNIINILRKKSEMFCVMM